MLLGPATSSSSSHRFGLLPQSTCKMLPTPWSTFVYVDAFLQINRKTSSPRSTHPQADRCVPRLVIDRPSHHKSTSTFTGTCHMPIGRLFAHPHRACPPRSPRWSIDVSRSGSSASRRKPRNPSSAPWPPRAIIMSIIPRCTTTWWA